MDSELLIDSLSELRERANKRSAPSFSYEEEFNRAFSFFLSIGMPSEEFWRGEPTLCQGYLKAEEMRRNRRNEELWMQGMYIYEALCDVSPLFRAFGKKGTKAHPYTKEPYPLKSADKAKKAETEKQKYIKNLERMRAMAAGVNAKFKRKGVKADAPDSD